MDNALWWESFLAVSYTAGTRLNETAHLTWLDVDFEASTVRVVAKPDLAGVAAWQPKDRDPRTIPVPEHTIDLLSRLQAEADEGSQFVFLSPARVAWIKAKREAGTWSEGQDVLNNVNKNFQRRASTAGVANVSVHDLRRSCLTNWVRALPIHVVRELAGHADIATIQRYYLTVSAPDLLNAREVSASALLVDPK